VLGRGDETAGEFAEAGFATLVDPGDAQAVQQAVLALADEPRALGAARRAGRNLADVRRWTSVAATLVAALHVALGLVFDPRYKDFPFAALTAGAVPFFIHSLFGQSAGRRGTAECVAATVLTLSVIYIVPNESAANWQSLWMCAALVMLALTLVRVRGAPD
jgi:hypothetical protein